ncbi:MAG: hypothetical protein IJG80_00270 [Selenomonadaceae bacterium]|nr:hypothetical protein [Selenomonadaceae bacterium]MBQ3727223.1 hypothetical protein [Selenomonadaceae bacterium]MBQ9498408.1 hypothetical protein [Selenomonadaceae bacterium]
MNVHENLHARLDAFLAENFSGEEFFAEDFSPPKKPAAEKISEKNFFAPIKIAEKKYVREKICYSHSAPDLLAKADFEKFFEEKEGETFSEMMMRLVEESGEKNSAVYKRAQIDRRLFSRIKLNKNYQPSKDTAVALALALKLNVDTAKNFLAAAGYTLTKSKRDLIITFFIENEIFDTALLNDYLYEYKQPILFSR